MSRFKISVIHVGKPNEQTSPKIDVYVFPNTKFVSRVHANILIKGNSYYIKDVGNANRTYVNNKLLSVGEEHPLHSGDRIALGKDFTAVFDFFSPGETKPESNPPKPPPVPDPSKPTPDPNSPKPIDKSEHNPNIVKRQVVQLKNWFERSSPVNRGIALSMMLLVIGGLIPVLVLVQGKRGSNTINKQFETPHHVDINKLQE